MWSKLVFITLVPKNVILIYVYIYIYVCAYTHSRVHSVCRKSSRITLNMNNDIILRKTCLIVFKEKEKSFDCEELHTFIHSLPFHR